jgi:hypothetical protein
MTKEELYEKMIKEIKDNHGDKEQLHICLDYLLFRYIDDERIEDLFLAQDLWYA